MGKLHSIILLISFAVAAVPACFAAEKPDTAPIISALIDVSRDADENVREAAYDALKTQPRSDELLELYWRGLDDDNPRIQTLSLNKVVELDGPTEKVLKRLILLTNEPTIRTTINTGMQNVATSHLISIGAPAIPYLIEALNKDEPNNYVIYALGRIPLGEHYATVTARLSALLKSENNSVRIGAIQSLHSILSAAAKAETRAEQAKALQDREFQRFLAYYEKLIAKYDTNKDGSLTEEEWSLLEKSPAAADSDGDGRITLAEFTKWSLASKNAKE